MLVSTRGRYALRVMIDLAQHDGDAYVPLKDVSERQQISKKYLEILVRDLVRGRMIGGVSGKGGGYRLLRKPEEYPIGEILELMEGSMKTVACLADDAPPCPRAAECPTISLWAEYDRMTHDYFYGKTLKDLL